MTARKRKRQRKQRSIGILSQLLQRASPDACCVCFQPIAWHFRKGRKVECYQARKEYVNL